MCTNRVIPAKNVDGNQTGSLFVDQVRLCGCLDESAATRWLPTAAAGSPERSVSRQCK